MKHATQFLLLAAAAMLPLGAARAGNNWTYYAVGAEGNPTNVACIAKGDWIVEVDIMTLSKGMFSPKKILGSASDGILDFRDLCIDGTAITDLNVRQGNLWADANVVEFHANHVTAFNGATPKGAITLHLPVRKPDVEIPVVEVFLKES